MSTFQKKLANSSSSFFIASAFLVFFANTSLAQTTSSISTDSGNVTVNSASSESNPKLSIGQQQNIQFNFNNYAGYGVGVQCPVVQLGISAFAARGTGTMEDNAVTTSDFGVIVGLKIPTGNVRRTDTCRKLGEQQIQLVEERTQAVKQQAEQIQQDITAKTMQSCSEILKVAHLFGSFADVCNGVEPPLNINFAIAPDNTPVPPSLAMPATATLPRTGIDPDLFGPKVVTQTTTKSPISPSLQFSPTADSTDNLRCLSLLSFLGMECPSAASSSIAANTFVNPRSKSIDLLMLDSLAQQIGDGFSDLQPRRQRDSIIGDRFNKRFSFVETSGLPLVFAFASGDPVSQFSEQSFVPKNGMQRKSSYRYQTKNYPLKNQPQNSQQQEVNQLTTNSDDDLNVLEILKFAIFLGGTGAVFTYLTSELNRL